MLVSRRAHGAHHRAPFEGNYCIVSGIWNPVLDQARRPLASSCVRGSPSVPSTTISYAGILTYARFPCATLFVATDRRVIGRLMQRQRFAMTRLCGAAQGGSDNGFFRRLERLVAAVSGVEPRCWYEPRYDWQEDAILENEM